MPGPDIQYKDPALPDNVTLNFRYKSCGRSVDHFRVEQEYERRDSPFRTLYILGINTKTDEKTAYPTGEAILKYYDPSREGAYGERFAREIDDILVTFFQGHRRPPPPYEESQKDIFSKLRFTRLEGVVGFLRHDIGEVVMRRDWSKDVLRNDVVVTALYSRTEEPPQEVVKPPKLLWARKFLKAVEDIFVAEWDGVVPSFVHPLTFIEDLGDSVKFSEASREMPMPPSPGY